MNSVNLPANKAMLYAVLLDVCWANDDMNSFTLPANKAVLSGLLSER